MYMIFYIFFYSPYTCFFRGLHGYMVTNHEKRNTCSSISRYKISFNMLIFLFVFKIFYINNLYGNKSHYASPISFLLPYPFSCMLN